MKVVSRQKVNFLACDKYYRNPRTQQSFSGVLFSASHLKDKLYCLLKTLKYYKSVKRMMIIYETNDVGN